MLTCIDWACIQAQSMQTCTYMFASSSQVADRPGGSCSTCSLPPDGRSSREDAQSYGPDKSQSLSATDRSAAGCATLGGDATGLAAAKGRPELHAEPTYLQHMRSGLQAWYASEGAATETDQTEDTADFHGIDELVPEAEEGELGTCLFNGFITTPPAQRAGL